VWHPNEPASGDVQTHGIYSFQNVIRSKEDYGYDSGGNEPNEEMPTRRDGDSEMMK
jgi:hypothetical protein